MIMKVNIKINMLIIFSFVITGCASPGVIPIGSGSYTVSSGTSAGFSSANSRAEVYKLANKFCEEKQLKMEQLSMDAREGKLGRNAPSATLVFKCS